VHQRQIDHQAALADAVPGRVVPTPAYRDLQRVRPGEVKRPRHVAGIQATHDHGRPTVHQDIEAAARCVEPGISGNDHRAGQRSPQPGQAVTGAGRTDHLIRIDRFTHAGNLQDRPRRAEDAGTSWWVAVGGWEALPPAWVAQCPAELLLALALGRRERFDDDAPAAVPFPFSAGSPR
jgi:hypothetical protein